MVKFTESDFNAMSLEDLNALTEKIKLAVKAKRSSENEKLAGTLSVGDKIEFNVPKSDKTEVAIVSKVKRVMIALKSPTSPTVQWNVPLTSIIKVIESAPVKRAKPSSSKKTSSKKTTTSVKKNVIKKNIVKTSKAKPTTDTTDTTTTTTKKVVNKPKKETDSNTKNLIAAIKAKAAAKKAASVTTTDTKTTDESTKE